MKTIAFALTDAGDIHVFPNHDMPAGDNVVNVEIDVAHENLLIIPADRAGPLRELLGVPSIKTVVGRVDTTALEAAAKHARAVADELDRLVDGDIEDDEEPGFRM